MVIAALQARLENAGYTVAFFRTIDAASDALPLVGLHFAPDGEQPKQSDGGSYPEQRFIELDVLLVDESDGNTQIDAVTAAEALRDTLITHRADKPDNIDGSCHWAEIVRMRVDTRADETDAIVSHVRVRAHY